MESGNVAAAWPCNYGGGGETETARNGAALRKNARRKTRREVYQLVVFHGVVRIFSKNRNFKV